MGINSAEAWDAWSTEQLRRIYEANPSMTTKTKYSGTHAIVVTCTSPRGARQVQFMYHYTKNQPDENGYTWLGYSADAQHRAFVREQQYVKQGWRTTQRTVDLRTVRKGRRP